MSEALTLEFLARQPERLPQELGDIHAGLQVNTATMQRLDSTVSGLLAEVRALSSQSGRFANRLARIETG